MNDKTLMELVHVRVRQIPVGQVMSYGQVGDEVGCSAREAGWAMNQAHGGDVPWQRVVGSDGYLRIGRRSPELMQTQRELLEAEGVTFKANGCVDMAKYQAGVIGKPLVKTLDLGL
jgi:methylated-DNA-protein-cysteine methyltransferase-like protein